MRYGVTMFVTDVGLNLYYQFALGLDVFTPGKLLYLGGNYVAYAAMIWLAIAGAATVTEESPATAR